MRRFPEVQECHMLMGEVRSSMALTPVKESTSLPFDLVAVAGGGED